MSEWGVVLVIVTLIGLVETIIKPILNLNTSIVRLTTQIEDIFKGFKEFKQRYTDNLDELKKADEKLKEKLDKHEHRITVLEDKNKE